MCTRPDNFDAIFARALAVRDGAEGGEAARRIVQLGSIHPEDPDFAAHVQALKRAGIPGIKLHPYYQGIRLDDPAFVPFFTALRDAGLFVMSHTGDDPGYMRAPSAASPAQIATLLRRVPGMKFVAAHLGGECGNPPHACDELLPFENCWIDTAVMCHHHEHPEALRIAREWPATRMMFGTDYFWHDQRKLMAWLKAARPDPAERELIFHANAERLLGIG